MLCLRLRWRLSGYPGRRWGWTDDWALFKGRGWKRRPLLDPKEETTLRMLLGEGWGSGGQSGDDGGGRYPRVPVALRQPSRGHLTQKGGRHGANLPMEEGPGLELRQENRGLKGFQAVTGTRGQSGRDPGDHGIAQVTAQDSPSSQGCSPAHTGAPPGSSVWGSEAPPSLPPPQGQLPCFQGTIC